MALRTALIAAGLILCTLGANSALAAESQSEVKSDSLRYLQDLREENSKRLQEIDATLSKKIEDGDSSQLEKEVTNLKADQHEHMLRQEFLDRLIFQIDTKFGGGDLRAFLEHALTDMAKVDAVSSSQAGNGLWKFMRYAADAVRRLPEQRENILSFLEGYMSKSVSHPVRPEDYLSSRNYTNGITSEAGNPVRRDQVGAIADRRIQEISAEAATTAVKTTSPAPASVAPTR